MKPLTERYQADLLGVLFCYDRMIITGTLPVSLLHVITLLHEGLGLTPVCFKQWRVLGIAFGHSGLSG